MGEVFRVALRLGLTSFGGPTAHVAYFREEYVVRRRWLDDARFGDLLALCQALPGPASSQLGLAIGTLRAGRLGGIAAWAGFTLPSALALVAFAAGLRGVDPARAAPWLHGLELAAVAVVASAVLGMAQTLAATRGTALVAAATAVCVLALPSLGVPGAPLQIALLALSAGLGARLWPGARAAAPRQRGPLGLRVLALPLACAALLVALPLAAAVTRAPLLALVDTFSRVGALVFGGGHVVLPLLETEVVAPGWMTRAEFVAGYGAAQAVPGPLFSFAAYVGWLARPGGAAPGGAPGAVAALVAVYLPSFLLVWGILPHWDALRARPRVQGALRGACACVVGLLGAALYAPLWSGSVAGVRDAALVVAAFGAVRAARVPPWAVVAGSAVVAGLAGGSAPPG